MKLYVSGPISLNGKATEEQVTVFTLRMMNAGQALRGQGHEVFVPFELEPGQTWEEFMRACIPAVCDADVIVMLPEWEKSRGAVFEFLVATTIGIEVWHVVGFTDSGQPILQERLGR